MELYLGIDSSNYTSSAAVLSSGGEILKDLRIMLSVEEGKRGLRQSDALFQHWKNLPGMLEELLKDYRRDIAGVCVSVKPRPADGSYMPVFTAGESLGRTIAASLDVPLYCYSHQEGHIAAASIGNDLDFGMPMVCAHLSGGTLELVRVENGRIELLGGTRDISYGQLLDRTGVALGFPFPAGKYIDEMALKAADRLLIADEELSDASRRLRNPFSRVFVQDMDTNLSGPETQLRRAITGLTEEMGDETQDLCFYLMARISESFVTIMETAKAEAECSQVLVSGGVASSSFLRAWCLKYGYSFGQPRLCSDNAVGLAYMKDRGLCL
jgi:N6-L-threonylcarbamoyladenine synthase